MMIVSRCFFSAGDHRGYPGEVVDVPPSMAEYMLENGLGHQIGEEWDPSDPPVGFDNLAAWARYRERLYEYERILKELADDSET